MNLKNPIIITPRLLPGVQIGKAFVSIEYAKQPGAQGRTRFLWHIDIDKKSFTGNDLQSGCQGGNLQEGLESLLSFLSAAPYDAALFTLPVSEWARENSDEISMLAMEIEETPDCIVE